jgi:CheY-like chemotaxis protein/nitrogen-specific signal transduction histidine kinase
MRKTTSKAALRRRRKGGRPARKPARAHGGAKMAPAKASRAEASRAEAARIEAALAALAHEIRTPLTGILALSELLAAAELPERERRWANSVKSAAEHLAQLTTLVVDGVRAETAGLVLRDATFRPRTLADEIATTLAARAESKGLAVAVTIPEDLPALVSGDQVRLRAALENLIDNAVKFTERGVVSFAVVARRARGKRHRLVFEVRDSGIGLTAAEIKQLFRPFAQANADIATRYGGSGLGLVFVRRVAAAMGGGLKITSRAGRGTTFRLEVLVAQGEARSGEGAVAARPDGTHLRVLCAEDNPYARVVLNTILTELGHAVDFVGSGAAAVEAAGRGYDVVLMDVALPDFDGREATRRIRALPGAAARTPVIGLSGHSEKGHETAARAAGMDGYLAKPVSPMALAQLLGAIISR